MKVDYSEKKILLQQKQSLPLDVKIRMSKQRIKDWYEAWEGKVYVSFSGGKDSTVLLHLVRSMYPDVVGVFCNTGLEFPEVIDFVKSIDNVIWLKPKMSFYEILQKYGYPVVSKEISEGIYEARNTGSQKLRNKRLFGDASGNGMISKKWQHLIDAPFKISAHCCHVLKKYPSYSFEKKHGLKPFVGTMAQDSRLREMAYLKTGCNSFSKTKRGRDMSVPLAFWTEEDIWEYIAKFDLKISQIYSMGYKNTGCVFCMFGVHLQKHPNKFETLRITHPKLYEYCINVLGIGSVLDFCKIKYGEQK